MGLDAGGAGCCRGRKMIEAGSEPLDRLLVKMAVARGVSGRRGGRLPPWPEVRRGGREPDERPSATVAGCPSFVPASVVGGHDIVECARSGQRAFGPSVDHRLAGLAAARGVSERRGSRLSPWPERVTSRWMFRGASAGEAAGGPRFVRASVVMPLAEIVGAGSEAEGVLWIVCWGGWRGLQVCPGFVIVGLPKGAGAGSEAFGCLVAGGSAVCAALP